MCGKFTLTRRKEEIIQIYKDRLESEIEDISKKIYGESYNIAPSQDVAVIYKNGTNTVFDYHRWGLIPYWTKKHLLKLLDCKYNDYLDFYQVSAAVNSPINNNIEILRRV